MQQLALLVLLQEDICCKAILYCTNHIYLYILLLLSVENSSSANKFHVFYYNKKNISMFLSTAILQESCCVCAEGCGKAFSSAGTGM